MCTVVQLPPLRYTKPLLSGGGGGGAPPPLESGAAAHEAAGSERSGAPIASAAEAEARAGEFIFFTPLHVVPILLTI